MKNVIAVKLELNRISHDFVAFHCGSKLSGIIHTPESGNMSVILDGGYHLGEYDCARCAIESVADLLGKYCSRRKRPEFP
ncbi:hypothetical protein QL203_02470 [Cronobacter malonaticus]|uniref:hypothetical protein n=1 Tax=Cronobacter malonaticus TaxID=413503 RepID=UPI0012D2E867|nr:hypothetical protein [Cronobacter malonaticus]MDI6466661.1 hypothetical protein [Cronobacter malonaticus]HAU5448949.1 hypothetical protein [Cronobacter malonaticus]